MKPYTLIDLAYALLQIAMDNDGEASTYEVWHEADPSSPIFEGDIHVDHQRKQIWF